MIPLNKGPEPAILQEKGETWRAEYLAYVGGAVGVPAAGRTRYANPEIKAALRIETRQKCAYCESRIAHVAPEHIEHIRPKHHRPDLVVTWTNLTLACPACNTNKWDYLNEDAPLLNPYVDEPEEHLLFVGELLLHRPGSDLGLRTIETIQLSRPALIESRRDRIRRLHPLVDQWARAVDPNKAILERQIRREAADEAEYAAAIRSYLRHLGFPLHEG